MKSIKLKLTFWEHIESLIPQNAECDFDSKLLIHIKFGSNVARQTTTTNPNKTK